MPTPIQNPTGYAIPRAIAYADTDGSMLQVAAASPLPVSFGAASTAPLAASSAFSTVAGPYQPALGRAVVLVLTGPGSRLRRGTRSVTSTTVATTIASKIITDLASTTNVVLYSSISGNGIPAGERVMPVDTATQVTIDVKCTATAAGVALTFQNDQTAIYTDTDGAHLSQTGHNARLRPTQGSTPPTNLSSSKAGSPSSPTST